MLPIKTSPDDVVAVVDYLKTKATGATLADAKAAIEKRLLDHRKMSAYVAWGFVERDGDKLKVSDLGRRFARASADERMSMFADVIRRTRAYRIAAEWLFHQNFKTITTVDLAAHWHEHVSDLGTSNETTIREQVNCFFQVAEAAGLGKYIVGRAGKPTRLDIDVTALGQFIAEMGLQSAEEDPEGQEALKEPEPETNASEAPDRVISDGEDRESSRGVSGESIRVFISHGKNEAIVDQVKTMLDFAELPFEVAVEEETSAIPVPDKVLGAMRRCTAAVICVTADQETRREDGTFGVNENVLIEIGAAFVLYEKRVVLVWDRRIPVPSNLQGLYRCEFEGDELSWGAGMKLMKAVNQFKR